MFLPNLFAKLALCLLANLLHTRLQISCNGWDDFWVKTRNCGRDAKSNYPNVPILTAAFCYNNGTGICKGTAGRFEFLFNSFNDKMLGAVGGSEFVSADGYHKRVPVAYNPDGEMIYADRSINWASALNKLLEDRQISLLSANEFNWCAYVKKDYWPYKSSFRDSQTDGRFLVYFFNRQSCIVDTVKKKEQHFNTRFLHNSSLRVDLDMNPLIFAMEDRLAGSIRLVKHKRQHWYEVPYRVVEQPTPDISYFVEMAQTEVLPCRLNATSGPILSKNAYKDFTDMCITDYYSINRKNKNAALVSIARGLEQAEISDYNPIYMKARNKQLVHIVDLHNIPGKSNDVDAFYGLNINTDEDWEVFAKDGFTFSATTTIPVKGDDRSVRVLSLYATFIYSKELNKYDEYYPMPYLADYITRLTPDGNWNVVDRGRRAKQLKNLNYVDDIAYLPACATVLIIFGPLYSEISPDNFGIESKGYVDSIYELGIWEMVGAFHAMDNNELWVYHRTNYLAKYIYKCKGDSKLVTASKSADFKYLPRYGANAPNFEPFSNADPVMHYEETFFKDMGVFKGSDDQPEAPDPHLYPIAIDPITLPAEGGGTSWLLIYILVGISAILLLAMCVTCLVTMRRRRKKRHHMSGPSRTRRSSMASNRASSLDKSRRSSMTSGGGSLKPTSTNRSKMTSSGSSLKPTSTNRSKMTSSGGSLKPTSTNRSKMTSSGGSLKPTSTNRSKMTSAGTSNKSSVSGSGSRSGQLTNRSTLNSRPGSKAPKTVGSRASAVNSFKASGLEKKSTKK